MGFGGTGGSSGSISGSSDVSIDEIADGDVLTYDSTNTVWTNAAPVGNPSSLSYTTTTTRPDVSGAVVFISATDPGSNAQPGDLWISA